MSNKVKYIRYGHGRGEVYVNDIKIDAASLKYEEQPETATKVTIEIWVNDFEIVNKKEPRGEFYEIIKHLVEHNS